MDMLLRHLRVLLFTVLLPLTAQAQSVMMPASENDSLQVWLITCDPGSEIYEYYGHTAIGFVNCATQDSIVVHYGVFDFNVPNFALRFMLGLTDYTSSACPWSIFKQSYLDRHISITAQRLLYSSKAAYKLYQSVVTDCTTPGWTYRYNFIYDNCATRIRDKIVDCAEYGFLDMSIDTEKHTIRDILHEHCKGHKWVSFGQDLLLGAEVDKDVSDSIQEFAPSYLAKHLDNKALLFTRNKAYRFVRDVKFFDPDVPAEKTADFPFSPMMLSLMMLALTLFISCLDVLRKKMTWSYDSFLLFTEGIVGCLVTFMFFFSKHPAVGSNWLVLFFNPIPLIGIFEVIRKEHKNKRSQFLTWWGVFISLFLLLIPILPQKISAEFILLAICLPVRSLTGYLVERTKILRKH